MQQINYFLQMLLKVIITAKTSDSGRVRVKAKIVL